MQPGVNILQRFRDLAKKVSYIILLILISLSSNLMESVTCSRRWNILGSDWRQDWRLEKEVAVMIMIMVPESV